MGPMTQSRNRRSGLEATMDRLRAQADPAELLLRIRDAHPEFPDVAGVIVPEGQNNLVVLTAGGSIVRYPRYPDGVAPIHREVDLLRVLADRLPARIPHPNWVHCPDRPAPDSAWRVGDAYVAYIAVPGQPLNADRFSTLGPADRLQLAQDIGEFLGALHGTAIPSTLGLPLVGLSTWEELAASIEAQLCPLLTPAASTWIRGRLAAGLGVLRRMSVPPTLVHGDFGTSNLLWDPDAHRLAGVIDFADAHRGDPALDLAALSAGFGLEFLRDLPYPDLHGMWERVLFYRDTFAAQDALFGLSHEDGEAVTSGMQAVEERAANNTSDLPP